MKKYLFFLIAFLFAAYIIKVKFIMGIFIGTLYISFFIFSLIKKNSISSIVDISIIYGKKAKVVAVIFILIGMLTASWISSGTIPGIVYYGLKLINPKIFILMAFLMSSVVAFLLGSSFGAVGTIGVAIMAMARTSDINLNIVGAAVISGIYFGDRWSPLSSSANLTASLTGNNIYNHLRHIFPSMVVPYGLTTLLYLLLSRMYVLNSSDSSLLEVIDSMYKLDVKFIFIPLASIIIFSLLRINVRISIFVSFILANIVSIVVQKEKFSSLLDYAVFGFYKFDGTALEKIIKGGGIKSMLSAMIFIVISCSLVGILEQLSILKYIKSKISNVKSRADLFLKTIAISIFTASIGGNQTISIVMTEQIMEEIYDKNSVERIDLAKDLSNTSILLPALIPWSLACYIPCTVMEISNFKFIPFAFFIYLVPLCSWVYYKKQKK